VQERKEKKPVMGGNFAAWGLFPFKREGPLKMPSFTNFEKSLGSNKRYKVNELLRDYNQTIKNDTNIFKLVYKKYLIFVKF
jgi:hypothetical protein